MIMPHARTKNQGQSVRDLVVVELGVDVVDGLVDGLERAVELVTMRRSRRVVDGCSTSPENS